MTSVSLLRVMGRGEGRTVVTPRCSCTEVIRTTSSSPHGSCCSCAEALEELSARGRSGAELDEAYGFLVENDAPTLAALCQRGAHARDNDYNALGYSRMGFYLCRHADVCLHHALIRFSGAPCIRLLVCKVRGAHPPRLVDGSAWDNTPKLCHFHR